LFAEQAAPELEWILLRRVRQFVHETFGDEAVERMADRAPVADVDADLLAQVSTATFTS
jgi:hypothetical protein